MTRTHVLVVGAALATEFARARPAVNLSVLSRLGAEPSGWLDRAKEINADHPVDRVVAFGENEQIVAALIAADLGLAGHHGVDVVRAVADKLHMRRRLADTGLGTVAYAEAPDAGAIERFARSHPAGRRLVKPVMGTGSRGVSELVDLRHCEAAFRHALQVAHPVGGIQRVMVEEFKPGRQLSVESLSEDGQHRLLAITQKYTDERTFAEVGHCVPAELSAAEADAVAAGTTAALDALGVRHGPTHTELVLNRSQQVDLIETHTRLGGHGIPHLVAAATGIDMYDLTFAQAAGIPVLARLKGMPARAGGAHAVWFGYAPVRGRVRSVLGGNPSDARLEVLVHSGDAVTADMTRSSRVVAARASGPTGAEAVRKAARAVSDTTVVIECSMTAQLLES